MAKLSLNKSPQKGMLTNSGTVELSKQRLTSSIQTRSPFKELFPINPSTLQAIEENIRRHGYDKSQPLHIWKEEGVLLDGHTRLQASLNNSLKEIPVFEHSFLSEEDALEYAISLQKNRRNLTDAEMLSCLDQLDQLKKTGRKPASNKAETKGKSAEKTAEILGTSRSKVEKMRSISKHSTPDIVDAVKQGKKTINSAYKETMESKKNKSSEKVSTLSPLPSPDPKQATTGNTTENDREIRIKGNTIVLSEPSQEHDESVLITVHPETHSAIYESLDSILHAIMNHLSQIF